ncbi:MAG: aminoglycoside phosphotransferase family protein [Actinobacteria bacterium]|nr:MAG: aminoglycoside phosphotransferase family protein [Actinomycetota bacterium]
MTGRLPDLDVVRGFLRESWDAGAALERLGMKHVRASADGDLRVLYEVPGRDGAVLRLSARRVSPEEGRRAQGPALYAPDLGLLFHVFPADRRLPALAVATDARAMRPVLEAALARVRDGATLAAVRIEVLRYKPERKCLLRYELAWDGAPASEIAYARVARWPRFQRNRDALRRIHEAAEGLAFALPEPLGVVPDLGMELFAHVPGVRLFTLVETAAFPRLCAQLGAALHDFHALPVVLDAERDPAEDVAVLRQSAEEFAWLLDAEAGRIRALTRRLAAALTAVPPASRRLVHGDFHGDNVLVDGDRLALIDLEDCAMGDPADDAALNWAQLTWHALTAAERSPYLPETGRDAFLHAFLARAEAVTAERLPVRAAIQCFLNAYQSVRRPQDPDAIADAQLLLGACEHVLERGLA